VTPTEDMQRTLNPPRFAVEGLNPTVQPHRDTNAARILGDVSLSIHDTARKEAKLHRDGREMVGRTIQQERLLERTSCEC
jgi:hypothetical protein